MGKQMLINQNGQKSNEQFYLKVILEQPLVDRHVLSYLF